MVEVGALFHSFVAFLPSFEMKSYDPYGSKTELPPH
jgi:hypothetical protein